MYDNASSGASFEEFAAGLTELTYTATGLTKGATYIFKIEARNLYGYSFFSVPVTILSAQIPD